MEVVNGRQRRMRPDSQPARSRMVQSAAVLVRERGVHGVGMRQIVAHAGGPRGSLQRYFPGGKTQLLSEALDTVGADIAARSELLEARTLPEAVDAVIAPWRDSLLDSDFTLGCPIAATIVDASGNDQLREKARALLAQWHDSVRDTLLRFGSSKSAADEQASVLLAALEGALILARAQRSTQPLDAVQRFFTTSLTRGVE
jgi:TetR/AcrR family transcriptional repressor of lmrAB and yxaGH operons